MSMIQKHFAFLSRQLFRVKRVKVSVAFTLSRGCILMLFSIASRPFG